MECKVENRNSSLSLDDAHSLEFYDFLLPPHPTVTSFYGDSECCWKNIQWDVHDYLSFSLFSFVD